MHVPSIIAAIRRREQDQTMKPPHSTYGDPNRRILRMVTLPHSRGAYRLRTWDMRRRYPTGQRIIGYKLTAPDGRTVFRGEDCGVAPSDAIDSDAALRGLLGFLTLKPGDTDDEYFERYTPDQRAFAESDAEELAMYCEHPDETGDTTGWWDFDAERWCPPEQE
jgi:hypothetical protein